MIMVECRDDVCIPAIVWITAMGLKPIGTCTIGLQRHHLQQSYPELGLIGALPLFELQGVPDKCLGMKLEHRTLKLAQSMLSTSCNRYSAVLISRSKIIPEAA